MLSDPIFIFDLDDTLAYTTRDLKGDPRRLPNLKLLSGIKPILRSIQGHSILLVAGEKEYIARKIGHLKLEGLFREILVVANSQEKEQVLSKIVADAEVPPSRITVVGDRIDHEIRFANQLCCTTVQMCLKGGKYVNLEPESGFDVPIHRVHDTAGLASVLVALL